MTDYIRKDHLFIKNDRESRFSEIDTIVFDVDGVLINVDSSYHQTIIDSVQYYFDHFIPQVSGSELLVNRQIITKFKLAGGFNNDWELIAAIILFYLWKSKEYHLWFKKELVEKSPQIIHFVQERLSKGEGLAGLEKWVKENASEDSVIFQDWDKEKIFQLAMEFYAGEKKCLKFYGFIPGMVHRQTGYIDREKRLVSEGFEENLKRFQVGILTGRNRPEAFFVLKRLGWHSWLNPEFIVTSDDSMIKPSPEGLEYFLAKFQTKTGLYIGDTMDDLLTVQRLNDKVRRPVFLSAIVLGEDANEIENKRNHFMENEADLLSMNVNQVLHFLFNNNEKFPIKKGGR